MGHEKSVIAPSLGQALAHDSAALQVQGKALYCDDYPLPEGALQVVPGFAPQASCGEIVKLDLSAVQAFPGVVRVLTFKDIPGVNDCSPAFGDDPIFAEGRISFHGQVIFAVVAKEREAARRAARLAVIEVSEEPAVVTVDQALKRAEMDENFDILPPYAFESGGVESALALAAKQLAGSLTVGGQEHFYLEGQVAFAVPEEDGGMVVYSSTQHPSEVQHCVAKMLGVAEAQVTCVCRRMGGGFGGKESQAAQWAALAALAAKLTGHAAKCRLDRDDDMIMTGKRHDLRVDYRIGFNAAGQLKAVDSDFFIRCGISADLSQGVCDRVMFHADNAYFYPDFAIKTRRLKTNTVSNTAFRGFGGPQGVLFAEQVMEAIAIATGKDALDVRLANLYGVQGDETPYHQLVKDCPLTEIIDQLTVSSDYRQRRQMVQRFNQTNRFKRKGLALTPVKFGISFTLSQLNQAGALVNVFSDGSVQLNHGGTEMGQGLYIKVAQVVADEFAIPLARVQIMATRTDKVPNTSPTAASSGTDLNGMAALNAARKIKQRMITHLAQLWQVEPDAIEFAQGEVRAHGQAALSFAAVAKLLHQARISLSATGFYATPGISWDREKGRGSPFFYYACGAACSEVVIDTLTGEMKVERVDVLHDVGNSLNPAIDLGQIEGGFIQGMGWLTMEELVFDDKGRLRTHAPSTYKIPCASDCPADFRVALYQGGGNKAETIYRSKAVGEPPIMLASSVWCAIYNALASLKPGQQPQLNAPATPEAIWRAAQLMQI